MKWTRVAILLVGMGLSVGDVFAYGPEGHKLIGEIADRLLEGKPVAQKISTLLEGMTLGEAALLPDQIKDWDQNPPNEADTFHLPKHPALEKQLIAYWEANSEPGSGGQPLHREFHFTDIPVKSIQKYADGDTGRSSVDLVQMMEYCVKILEGKISENNPHKITKPIAVVLLAHFTGDIHQPLHVGAEYFNKKGKMVDPDANQAGYPDRGGNSLGIDIEGVDAGTGRYAKNLHSFWDGDSVVEALKQVKHEIAPTATRLKPELVVDYYATHEPSWHVTTTNGVEGWAEAWANEIQPIAREAHQRLDFVGMYASTTRGETIEKGTAKEKPASDHVAYLTWAGQTVKGQLGKAGWRLAGILETSLP